MRRLISRFFTNEHILVMILIFSLFDSDTSWISLLELHGPLPKPKRRETVVDTYLRQKNLGLLRVAMKQSLQQDNGFLPAKEVVQLSLAYSIVYYMGLDQERIRGAINWARSQQVHMGMVNIDKYVVAIMESIA